MAAAKGSADEACSAADLGCAGIKTSAPPNCCTVYILNRWDEEIAPGYGSRAASLQFTSAISSGKTTDPPT